MKLKKFFAGVVAAAMMLTMGATAAFATELEPVANKTVAVNNNTVTVQKIYKLDGQGISPEETFNFTISNAEVTNAGTNVNKNALPVPTIGSAKYEATVEGGATTAGNTKNITIDFKKVDGSLIYTGVGIYTYQVAETAGKTLGVAYDTKTYTMKVTVVNGDAVGTYKIHSVSFTDNATKQKDDAPSFTNTYTANTLSVSKTVDGALGDKDYPFEFTVNFAKNTENAEKTWTDAITAEKTDANNNKSTVNITSDSASFTLKHGESIKFSNVPAGLTYTVSETAVDGYETKINGSETATAAVNGKVTTSADTDNAEENVTYKNIKGIETPDTGVILDNAPYIALLAIVAFGGVALILNKRRRDEE